jgi:hypothetical protein
MFYDGFEKLPRLCSFLQSKIALMGPTRKLPRLCSFLQSKIALMGPTRESFTKTSLIIHGLVGDTKKILEYVAGNLPMDYAWFIISRFGA